MDALAKIVREERFVGLYKGIVSPLVSTHSLSTDRYSLLHIQATTALMNGLVFASYRFLLKLQSSDSALPPTLTQITLAGAGSGIISSIITTPTELIKIRQQQQIGLVQRSTLSVAVDIIRTGGFGLKGLYRGMPVTALRDIGYGGYFWAYEATCRAFAPSSPNILDVSVHPDEIHLLLRDLDGSGSSTPSWAVMLLAGGLAGIAGWLTTFPLDVIKTRMQGAAMGLPVGDHAPLLPGAVHSNPNPYRTIWSTITHSYKAEGAGVFFRGLAPTLIRSVNCCFHLLNTHSYRIRAVPVNMATFATFEAIVRLLS